MKKIEISVFPTPKEAAARPGTLDTDGLTFDLSGIPPKQRGIVRFLAKRHFPEEGSTPCRWIQIPSPALYEIETGCDGILVKCGEESASTAFRTLLQIGKRTGAGWTFPLCRIRDFPDFRRRGLYLECSHGTDLMSLKDYREMLDMAWELKFNHITLGVYGCWSVRQFPEIEEFYFLPPGKYGIRSHTRLRYYSARRGKHVRLNRTPFIAQKRFLRDITAYAEQLGIGISWHFNTLGHNTLLPRLLPEISAKDSEGKPKGLSFCLTNPETKRILADILRELVRTTGVKKLHIGMDEVFPLFMTDPDHPFRRVSPRCRCAQCRKHRYSHLILNHIIGLLREMKAAGLEQVSLWHDQITRMGLAGELEKRLKEENLQHFVMLECWYYNNMTGSERKKPYVFPDVSLAKAIVPMAGFAFWGHFPDHTHNIIPLLKNEHGAEAAEAYALYNPAFHYNYACLAQSAWHAEGNSPINFFRLYLKHFHPDASPAFARGLAALLNAERNGISRLLFAFANPSENYPADRIRDIQTNHPETAEKMPELVRLYGQAMCGLRGGTRKKEPHGNVLYAEAARCRYLAEIFHMFLTKLTAMPGCFAAPENEIENMRRLTDRFIRTFEENYPPALLPQSLRFIGMIRDFITDDIEVIQPQTKEIL